MPDAVYLKARGATMGRRASVHALARVKAPRRPAGRVETLIFRVAMSAGALWVLDDAFWHLEPGTAVGDHLVSGLVPLAGVVLLAVAYPRLRAGARAAAAL